MNPSIIVDAIPSIDTLCSCLGKRALSGDVNAVKGLYGAAWKEHPAIIRIITRLQECLTGEEINMDVKGIYSTDFLYYWGMIGIGELSTLITKDLGTAKICFDKIANEIPKAKAKNAYIELLETDEPAKSDENIKRLDMLRQWASKGDLFSRIVLAKICFYQFLNEKEMDDTGLPIRVLRLLELPCQKGHPVAIRFWNEILDYIGTLSNINLRMDETRIQEQILFDL